ncbi:hypothetical protein [Streptomyces mirabilis]|uniref:hypothetical protein n=1 Tax=Streptomyces mirabilis TaxID=68239 RepID=UPI00382D6E4E
MAVLHDAPTDLIEPLRTQAAHGPSAAFPLLGQADLTATPSADALASRLGCAGLRPTGQHRVDELLRTEHRPSPTLLARAGDVIEGRDAFTLIGDQDLARRAGGGGQSEPAPACGRASGRGPGAPGRCRRSR